MAFRKYTLLFVLVLFVTLSACKKKEEAAVAPASAPEFSRESKAASTVAEGDMDGADNAGKEPAVHSQRKIIVTHDLTVEVKNVVGALESATKLAVSSGGYVTESNRNRNYDGSFTGRVGMRIPHGKVAGALNAIKSLGAVTEESSTGEDITDQYVDMEARMRNAKASEQRLLGLYKQAGKLSDVLEVEKELTRVRGDIEAFEATKRNWDIQVSLVKIDVTFTEPPKVGPTSRRVWTPLKTAFADAIEAFAGSLNGLIIFIGLAIPWVALLAGLAYAILWIRKRRKISG